MFKPTYEARPGLPAYIAKLQECKSELQSKLASIEVELRYYQERETVAEVMKICPKDEGLPEQDADNREATQPAAD